MDVIEYDEIVKERVDLLRAAFEFKVAAECIEKHKLDYLFLDGSLHAYARKKRVKCSEYKIYRDNFQVLMKECRKKKIHLAGVSEDSESRSLMHHLGSRYNAKFPRYMTDSSLLRSWGKSQRFKSVEYTPSGGEFDFGSGSNVFMSFPTVFIQPSKTSNPLKIDAPHWEKDLEGIAAIVAGLCKGARVYGYPHPLYLVHLDVQVKRKEANRCLQQFIKYFAHHDKQLFDSVLREKRRGLRP